MTRIFSHLEDTLMENEVFAGVDVGKGWLDLAVLHHPSSKRFSNDRKGIARLIKELDPGALVAMESSGGYERSLLKALQKAGVKAARVDARRTRRFAEALGLNAKTDSIDAQVIAKFASAVRPSALLAKSESIEQLEQLSKRRSDIIAMRTREKNRQEHYSNKLVLKTLNESIERLTVELKIIDKEMARIIRDDPKLCGRAKVLREQQGVGPATVAVLIARMPELGTLNRKQVAALGGLAPFNHDSGMKTGQRFIRGGRHDVRATLYMAALTAIRTDAAFKSFYARLRSNGKPAKVAIVACMRKLLIQLNGKVREANVQQIAAE